MPQKSKGGGTPHNTNALRSGLRSCLGGSLTIGKLPPRMSGVKKKLSTFLKYITNVVEEKNGGCLDEYQMCLIQTALRWEMASQLSQQYMRDAKDLTHSNRLDYIKTIAWASQQRDAMLKQLGLDKRERADVRTFYATPVPTVAGLLANEKGKG